MVNSWANVPHDFISTWVGLNLTSSVVNEARNWKWNVWLQSRPTSLPKWHKTPAVTNLTLSTFACLITIFIAHRHMHIHMKQCLLIRHLNFNAFHAQPFRLQLVSLVEVLNPIIEPKCSTPLSILTNLLPVVYLHAQGRKPPQLVEVWALHSDHCFETTPINIHPNLTTMSPILASHIMAAWLK